MAISLVAMPVYNLTFAQENGSIEYAENRMDPVATYTAVDPEMTEIISWSLDGTDKGVFDINDGVLTFKKSPDFEMPGDVAGTSPSTAAADDNMYEVTVQATDSTNKMGMKEVMVEVTNVEETGTVTLSALRPQSNVAFTATLTDPDGDISGTTWQWAKAGSKNGSYTPIDKAMSMAYTPVDADIGSYLRVTASYTDGEGSDKRAMAKSENSVQRTPGDNKPPKFADDQDPDTAGDQAEAAREVPENTPAGMAIGDPVVADPVDGDILTYTLTGTAADSFDIDWATGQIMTKGELDYEDGQNREFEVTVRATDPSGIPGAASADSDNSDTVGVTITVKDVNEPPTVTGDAEVTFQEEAGAIATGLDMYTADDPEDDTPITWSVEGADGSKFTAEGGDLKFKAKPDFEMAGDANGDNVYEVTVVATAAGKRGDMDVKVAVANEEEAGTVTLSRTQPRVEVAVTASLKDPDGSISGLKWQWYRGDNITAASPPTTECANDNSDDCLIKDAKSATYLPTAGDVGETLAAVATYTDGHAATKSAAGEAANMTEADTRNKAPAFADQDLEMDGVQNTMTTREVDENTKALAGSADDDAVADATADNVGSLVMADDPDPNTDPLIYTLSGADAGLFRVRDNGQIEVGDGTELDYEGRKTYEVMVMAEDSFEASASIMVTIMVTDLDEVPEVTGDAAVEYAENRMDPVATYTAVDPEMTEIISWSLDGTDKGVFDINDGVLTFKKSPDFEMPGDVAGTSPSTAAADDNMYEVTVQATDSTNKMGMKEVMVEVTNVEETGTVTLSALRPQSNVAFTATLTDPDGDISGTTWQWAKAGSKNGSYTPIDKAMSMAYTPVDADIGSYLRVTASYTDGEGSDKRAMAKSENSVQRTPGDNKPPKFADDQDPDTAGDQAEAAREVPENTPAGMAIGDPVVADPVDGDILTYTLTGTAADSFDIDWATGQIMTKGELDYEDGQNREFEVTVRATDPSGIPGAASADSDNSDTVGVTITVKDVNEPPTVTGDAEVTFQEEAGAIATGLDMYTADDPEDDTPITWSVEGADGSKFTAEGGDLKFKAKPDFEMAGDANGDNVYEVTVVATAAGKRGDMDVKVAVANEEEAGTVTPVADPAAC